MESDVLALLAIGLAIALGCGWWRTVRLLLEARSDLSVERAMHEHTRSRIGLAASQATAGSLHGVDVVDIDDPASRCRDG